MYVCVQRVRGPRRPNGFIFYILVYVYNNPSNITSASSILENNGRYGHLGANKIDLYTYLIFISSDPLTHVQGTLIF